VEIRNNNGWGTGDIWPVMQWSVTAHRLGSALRDIISFRTQETRPAASRITDYD
jgi:hypothetical protein